MIRHEDLFEDTAFLHFHFSAFTDHKQNETPDEHFTVFSKMPKNNNYNKKTRNIFSRMTSIRMTQNGSQNEFVQNQASAEPN